MNTDTLPPYAYEPNADGGTLTADHGRLIIADFRKDLGPTFGESVADYLNNAAALVEQQAQLRSILATVVHDRHRGIVQVPMESMNALAASGRTLQVNIGHGGADVVLRIVDLPEGNPADARRPEGCGYETRD